MLASHIHKCEKKKSHKVWIQNGNVKSYHDDNQVQLSKEKNEQKHPTQNLEYFLGILPDQELYDPAIIIIVIEITVLQGTKTNISHGSFHCLCLKLLFQ